MKRHALVAMLLVACGRVEERKTENGERKTDSAGISPAGSFSVSRFPASSGECPKDGTWRECGVFERLDRSGLAPRRDSATVRNPKLTPKGSQILVGSGSVELYFYADARAREREQGTLDKTEYVSFDVAVTRMSQSTLITNANLIAILHSRNDHLRERVADAITAGPPQPSTPANP